MCFNLSPEVFISQVHTKYDSRPIMSDDCQCVVLEVGNSFHFSIMLIEKR